MYYTEDTSPPDRRGAYSAAALTLAAFLLPALFAPGPIELANVAGCVFALWMAADVWRRYGRLDAPSSLVFRVGPVAPGVVASAAVLFAIALLHAWDVVGARNWPFLEGLEAKAVALWAFPFSPLKMYLDPSVAAPAPTQEAARLVTLVVSAAIAVGGLFALFALVAHVGDRETLRRHALIWKGVRSSDAVDRLAERGARGLTPIRDPFSDVVVTPVAGRLLLRALALVLVFLVLLYGPFVIRWIGSSAFEPARAFFESAFVNNAFFPLWVTALWGVCLAGTLIHVGAYLRLAMATARG